MLLVQGQLPLYQRGVLQLSRQADRTMYTWRAQETDRAAVLDHQDEVSLFIPSKSIANKALINLTDVRLAHFANDRRQASQPLGLRR